MCCGLIFRCLMYAITAVTVFVAASILGVGSSLAADLSAYLYDVFDLAGESIDSNLYIVAVYIMITVGGLLFCTAVFGCCGAWRGSSCFLLLFNIIAFCIIGLIFLCGIFGAVYKNSLDQGQLEDTFESQVQTVYGAPGNESTTDKWDNMQTNMKCCGSTSYTDYAGSYYERDTNNTYPESCCEIDDYNACLKDNTTVYQEGCATAFSDQVHYDSDVVMGVCFGLGALVLIGILVSCFIKGRIEEENQAV